MLRKLSEGCSAYVVERYILQLSRLQKRKIEKGSSVKPFRV